MGEESLDMNEGNPSGVGGFPPFAKPSLLPTGFSSIEMPRLPLWPSHPSEWLHVTPSSMPWSTPMSNQTAVVRFTAGPQQNLNQLLHKRKFDDEVESDLPDRKMHITEEKMAAHMNDLHISNTYTSHCVGKPTLQTAPENNISLDIGGQNMMNLPQRRLVLSEELQRMKNEPLLPAELLRKLQVPSTALVLWQPPAGVLGDAIKSVIRTPPTPSTTTAPTLTTRRNSDDEEVAEVEMENNNSAIIDLNMSPQNQIVNDGLSSASVMVEEMDL